MIRILSWMIAGIFVLVLMPTSAGASTGCRSMSEARRVWPDIHLRYRLEGRRSGGRKCWYAHAAPKVRTATKPTPARDEPRWYEPPRDAARRVTETFDPLAFFMPQPARVEPVEEIEPVRKTRTSKSKRIAQAAPPKRQPSVDEQIRYLCGDFDHGYCNKEFRSFERERRAREARP